MASILIVDDSKFMRKMISDILIEEGHKIAGEAKNAKEAIEFYKRLKPDLVTLDIILPDAEGVDAISALNTMIKADPSAKVVVVSAMGQQEVVEEYMQAGAKDFIVKPFQPANITKVVKRVLQE